jgi:hypothetical protein
VKAEVGWELSHRVRVRDSRGERRIQRVHLARADDEHKKQTESHCQIGARLVNHAKKSVARKFCQRKTPETVAEQNGNLGRNNRHANIDKQQNCCEPRE